MRKHPRITAHSGCEGTARDSMASVYAGIVLGADAVEMDVRRTPQGEAIVAHDPFEGGPCVALEEVLACLAPHASIAFNCDLKEPAALDAVLALAARYGFGRERLILSGALSPAMLRENPAVAARAQVYLNVEQILAELVVTRAAQAGLPLREPQALGDGAWVLARAFLEPDYTRYAPHIVQVCRAVGAACLNLPHTLLTRELMERLCAHSLPVSVWTVNDPADIRRMLALGVSNLTTLNVRQAKAERTGLPATAPCAVAEHP